MSARVEAVPLDKLQAGDSAAWRVVMTELGPSLLGYATRMLNSRSRAEDVVQESLVGAYKSIGKFEGRSTLKTWLFRIVHNRALDELKRNRRYVPLPEDDPEASYFDGRGRWASEGCPQWSDRAEEQIDAGRRLEQVRAAMDELPHNHREVLLLKEIHGLRTEEICESLQISPGNLRIRLHRARKALRAAVIDAPGASAEPASGE